MTNQLTKEQEINKLNYMNERLEIKADNLLQIIADQADKISELQTDLAIQNAQVQSLNKQLQEAQG